MSASGGAAASEAANSLFGFALRPSQAQTVEAILEGRGALAVPLTGSDKSVIRLWGEGRLPSRDDHELLVYFDRR